MGIFEEISKLTGEVEALLDDNREIKEGDSLKVIQQKASDAEAEFLRARLSMEAAQVTLVETKERFLRLRLAMLEAARNATS